MPASCKAVYIATTVDTKGPELAFVRQIIHQAGVRTVAIDLSTRPHDVPVAVDISAAEIAGCHPQGADAVFCGERGQAIAAMALAFRRWILTRDDIVALLGLGGSGGTALITPAMQALPVGIAKLMVSTMACGDTAPYVGASDIGMLYPVTDVAGINRISRKILTNAACQVAGVALFASQEIPDDLPAIGLSMFGVTTLCVQQISAELQQRYDCLVFHATGSGGNALEHLIRQKALVGVIDITLTEIGDLLFGGVLACAPGRLEAITDSGTPWVGSCGALDMVNFAARDQVPERYQQRQLWVHNPQVTLMRTTIQENQQMGYWIAEKLNRCPGEVRFLIPLKGFSALDAEGQPFWDPEADNAFISALENTLVQTPRRRLIKLSCHINSPEFARTASAQFQQIVR